MREKKRKRKKEEERKERKESSNEWEKVKEKSKFGGEKDSWRKKIKKQKEER